MKHNLSKGFIALLPSLLPLPVLCQTATPVPPSVVDMVLSEISPDSVDRALGHLNQKTPCVHLGELDKRVRQKLEPDLCHVSPPTPRIVKIGEPEITGLYLANVPNEDRFVAVIATVRNEPAILNPSKYFVYDSIPKLGKLTKLEADKLWGTPRKRDKTAFEYRLLSTNNHGKVKVFLIQARFNNEGIQEYQIKGTGFRCIGWRSDEQ